MKLALLLAAGLLSGILTAWVYRRAGRPAETRIAFNRMLAYFMEFRLFIDEPALILRAQWHLLKADFDLLRSIARPSLLLLIPFALITVLLDATFGIAPLSVGQAAVLTVPYHGEDNPHVQAPPGIAVETEGVRALSVRQISYRLRPLKNLTGNIIISAGGHTISKRIVAGEGWPVEFACCERATINYQKGNVAGWPWWIWYGLGLLGALIRSPLKSDFRYNRHYDLPRQYMRHWP